MSSTFYNNNNTSKFLTPNKMNKLSKSSSNFFIGDKNHFNKNNKFINTIKYLQEKKINLSKILASLIDSEENKDKIQNKKYSLPDNSNNKTNSDIISMYNKIYIKSHSKDNSLSRNRNKNKLNNFKIIHKSNSLNINNINKKKIIFDNNIILPSIK